MLFATAFWNKNEESFYRVEHADGYLSLLPRQYVIPESRLTGPPTVLGNGKLAIGGRYQVYLVSLDDKGVPTGDVIQTRVLSPGVRALVYSPKFDRLYVGVELSR